MSTINISQAQKDLYRDEGYMILERAIPDDLLELLRGQCQEAIDRVDRRMDEAGTDTLGINHRGSRYFAAQQHQFNPANAAGVPDAVFLRAHYFGGRRQAVGQCRALYHRRRAGRGGSDPPGGRLIQ